MDMLGISMVALGGLASPTIKDKRTRLGAIQQAQKIAGLG